MGDRGFGVVRQPVCEPNGRRSLFERRGADAQAAVRRGRLLRRGGDRLGPGEGGGREAGPRHRRALPRKGETVHQLARGGVSEKRADGVYSLTETIFFAITSTPPALLLFNP